ncbi:(2Fe-2S)-binding protein [Caldalkalibacillus mannanilyticus]|uniref:(2Fe-2S)-binding protein n=1 Tax=Caldalkalibacillus mannanilyticus TaxID=1418 RepID=UPI00054E10F7|nr:(2Fe-2S)-binding protein [Caldalkalibacillus mannanilyticus]
MTKIIEEAQTILCRCEEVTLLEVVDILKKYQCSSREMKLRTRAGMGICGGRTCRPLLDQLFNTLNKEQLPDHMPLKYQPPIRPVLFSFEGDIDDSSK